MAWNYDERGTPRKAFKSKFGGWRLRDGNGEVCTDEYGEPFEFSAEAEASAWMSSWHQNMAAGIRS